ncbi:MAG: Rad52/Rad22 family DNA repair protein [Chloroflexota bacterium]|nr:Rad52/Rad22 family DNA repair protein [Chloroflexota bacterium]
MGNGNNNQNGNGHHPNGSVNLNGNDQNGHHGGNGVADITGHDLLWDGLPPAVVSALEQPLDPALVSRRDGRGNRQYEYIEGHTVIDQANRIFGYGGWGYDLAGDVSLRRIEKVDVRTGELKVNYAYSAPVRVSVVGAPPRTDIGFHIVAEDTPEGHETAAKGAVTDGLKRALRSFGDRFGNGLYGDQPPTNVRGNGNGNSGHRSNGQGNNGNANSGNGRRDGSYLQQLRGRLIDLGAKQGYDEDRVREAVKKQTSRDLDDLPARDLKPLVENAARKVNEAIAAEGGNGNG